MSGKGGVAARGVWPGDDTTTRVPTRKTGRQLPRTWINLDNPKESILGDQEAAGRCPNAKS